jgi:hypothetical protein
MVSIMTNKVKKLRNKVTKDEYFTYESWDSKEIDNVVFVPVVKKLDPSLTQVVLWMKKESLETVK